ncbi:hypothetical protein C8J57DRAFT_1021725, partial [Mycena rebaudengoi]
YFTVTEHEDGTLTCDCEDGVQTGITCEHIAAVRLEITFGNIKRYEDLETIRRKRGPNADGAHDNPPRQKTGRQQQRCADRSVTHDVDRFLEQVRKANSDSDSAERSDGNDASLGVDDPLERKGTQLSRGRMPATTALHPGRTAGEFSNPPGPKRGPANSLLPGSS